MAHTALLAWWVGGYVAHICLPSMVGRGYVAHICLPSMVGGRRDTCTYGPCTPGGHTTPVYMSRYTSLGGPSPLIPDLVVLTMLAVDEQRSVTVREAHFRRNPWVEGLCAS